MHIARRLHRNAVKDVATFYAEYHPGSIRDRRVDDGRILAYDYYDSHGNFTSGSTRWLQ